MPASSRASFSVIVPARFASKRLPGKPLIDLCGKPMIQWVWERARASGAAQVIVATDDERIVAACRAFGAETEMTAGTHPSGTDRLAEVARRRGFAEERIVVNVQGDEPLIRPESISALADVLQERQDCDMATPVAPIESLAQWQDPNCVKAVRDLRGDALYFSRAPIPWPRDAQAGAVPCAAWRHIGLYAYRTRSLQRFAAWPPGELEGIEKLEQLRALEHGLRIHLLPVMANPPAGVDTPEDLDRVRTALAVENGDGRMPAVAGVLPVSRPS